MGSLYMKKSPCPVGRIGRFLCMRLTMENLLCRQEAGKRATGSELIVQAQSEYFVGPVINVGTFDVCAVVVVCFFGVFVVMCPEIGYINAPCLCKVDSGSES